MEKGRSLRATGALCYCPVNIVRRLQRLAHFLRLSLDDLEEPAKIHHAQEASGVFAGAE